MSNDKITDQAETTVKVMWDLNLQELEIELGRRLELTRREFDSETSLTAAYPSSPAIDDSELMGSIDELRGIAGKFLNNLNREFYSLVCDRNDPDNKKILAALDKGAESAAYVLVALLAANFGMLPGIAIIVAVLIAKRFAGAAHKTACELWKQEIH
ncbi:hypothetical protein ACFL36_03270 [Thermodesulfobacteriota bacterium]